VTLLATCFRAAALMAAISLLAVVGGGCGGDGAADEGGGTGGGDAVEIVDFAYAPGELKVDAGTTVSFSNRDSTGHTATADDSTFDTGTIEGGESGSVKLTQPGTYRYYCLFHPFMRGTVTVK
jgi:plastocyanin